MDESPSQEITGTLCQDQHVWEGLGAVLAQ